jgi:PAS domain-containing protein
LRRSLHRIRRFIRCTPDGSLETLYLSQNVPALLDLSREEYLKITQRDAMDLTLPADRPGLRKATADCLRTGKPFNYYYRVFHNKKGFEWVHVHAHVCGTLEGSPLILALFANMTTEGGIYQQILDASDRKTLVIDRDSFEILYANDPAAADEAGSVRSLLDQKCHAFLHGLDSPCANCLITSQQSEKCSEDVRFDGQTGKWERLTRRFISGAATTLILVYTARTSPRKKRRC